MLPIRAQEQFVAAVKKYGETVKHYVLGNKKVTTNFAGSELLNSISPALAHCETVPDSSNHHSQPDLTIYIWQSDQPPLQQSNQQWSKSTAPVVNDSDNEWIHYQADIGLLSWYCDGYGFVCVRDVTCLPPWELAVPLRSLWNASLDGCLVHGAAVGNQEHAVLLAGVGGSGKSTTALTCLAESELYHLGDDLCLITNDYTLKDKHRPTPVIHSLYNTAKLLTDAQANLKRILPTKRIDSDYQHDPDGLQKKETFFLFPELSKRLAHERPLCAILLPKVTNNKTTQLTLATKGAAWHAIVPVTLSLLGGMRPKGIHKISEIIQQLPVYHLNLGSDRKEIVEVISNLLDKGVTT